MIIAAALLAHRVLSRSSQIPPIDNPMALIDAGQRFLTALWIQGLYLFKTLLPITLSADYSYKQIRLVMGPDDWRAWIGLALAGGAILSGRAVAWEPAARAGLRRFVFADG